MITKDNLNALLSKLNFVEKDNIFSKHFPDLDVSLQVNFKNNLLFYPTDKGFIVNGEFTCNFSSNENFVVFECVHRLFEKGYKPEHIELEPKWKVGHGASGGRADIMIKDYEGKSLLIIECKTEGTEFNKEWNNTLHRGGQMLTYAKQAGTTQFVCLYASDYVDDNVIANYNVISLLDNKKLLEELKDKEPLSYEKAKALEVEDIYKAWKETYNLDFATKGIFEDDIPPYQIGKQNYTVKDLNLVGSKDIQSKYHEFATILRQHNVSGRENAFDKLVNLFLCKIVDEKKNPNNLKFYWKGITIDSYFDLQDRLQLLYKSGMKEFLGEDVTYIDNAAIDNAFHYFKQKPDATKETIKKYFRQLKFFTNNDFAFIDVHNEKLFYQNATVLLKIVQMLQDTKLESEDSQNQFLGDMFEGFLDQGVKQSEGQFFTPMPIVKFIMSSLPLEKIITDSDLPPKAIDYACGAGHFLNELALQIKPFVAKHKEGEIRSVIKDYYKEIVGIEKEYRLSKVAKVSAFMYGQDEINITYADALGNKAKLEEGGYSILVANPPYSVKGFLQTLSEAERKAFTLINTIDEKSLPNNNSIETFFIERAKQLLKPGGVAGIILPSSILSNDSNIYVRTREIIIKYFTVIAIVELGSQTFGKTGTNTVTLFLKRKEENPAPADHWKSRVDAWFSNDDAAVVYADNHYINNYCNHIGIDHNHYKTLLSGKPNEELLATEMFVEYKKAFDNTTEIKNLKKPNSAFSKTTKEEQEALLTKKFIDYIMEVEKDKLYYYVLAVETKQRVVVVKCPSENKEQKQFLGYEWSSAKGNEGIKYLNQTAVAQEIDDAETKEMLGKLKGLQNINTPLYSPVNRADNNKINHIIEQNYLENEVAISDGLSNYIAYYSLADMLDFTRKDFNKQILLTPKKVTSFETKWELVRLDEKVEPMGGLWTGKQPPFKTIKVIRNTNFRKGGKLDLSDVAKIEVELKHFENRKLEVGDIVIEKSGGSETQAVGRVIIFTENDDEYSYSNFTARLRVKSVDISSFYLHLLLNYFYELGYTFPYQGGSSGLKNLDLTRYLEIKIPLPPKEIQDQIISECEVIDSEVEVAEKLIIESKDEIKTHANELFTYPLKKLGNVCIKAVQYGANEKAIDGNPKIDYRYIRITDIKEDGSLNNDFKTAATIDEQYILEEGDFLFARSGNTVGKTFLYKKEYGKAIFAGYLLRFKTDQSILKPDLLNLITKSDNYINWVASVQRGASQPNINGRMYSDYEVPLPSSVIQNNFINDFNILEQRIKESQAIIDGAAERKKEVMRKYL